MVILACGLLNVLHSSVTKEIYMNCADILCCTLLAHSDGKLRRFTTNGFLCTGSDAVEIWSRS